MGVLKSALKTGIIVKGADLVRREMRKPENQRRAKELMAKVQTELKRPENQQKAKDLLAKVSKKKPGTKH